MNDSHSKLKFFLIWLNLGLQSFGGGVATFALIRQAAVNTYKWTSEEDFTRDWGMVQLAPGVNLLALVILLGRRVMGLTGILLALFGLMLPCVLITTVLTIGYSHISGLPAVQHAIKGALPAIVALGLLSSYQMAVPIIKSAKRESPFSIFLCIFLMVASGWLLIRYAVPVFAILICAGAVLAIYSTAYSRKHGDEAALSSSPDQSSA